MKLSHPNYLSCCLMALSFTAQAEPISVQMSCERLGTKLASVSIEECLSLNLQADEQYTAHDKPILYKEYPPLEGKKARARVLLLGGMHGDEYSSFSVLFKWMHILEKHHSGLFHWQLAPSINLNGLLKNPAVRGNANGVDLNRNLPTGAWEDALHFWKEKTQSNPRRYPGKAEASEIETQWLVHKIKAFKPDVIISVHAPYGLVDYDGPQEVRRPVALGKLRYKDLATFPGSLGRYGEEVLDIPVLTIELSSARKMPSSNEVKRIWLDLVQWLIHGIGVQE